MKLTNLFETESNDIRMRVAFLLTGKTIKAPITKDGDNLVTKYLDNVNHKLEVVLTHANDFFSVNLKLSDYVSFRAVPDFDRGSFTIEIVVKDGPINDDWKHAILYRLLWYVKHYPEEIESTINELRYLGIDYPEFDTILKSVRANEAE